jgi:hypothetical protein
MLALFNGVQPIVTPDRKPETLERQLIDRGLLPAGATVVFINVSPDLTRTDMNFLNLQRIG